MTITKGRIGRTGTINFSDASISIWEEGISQARNEGGYAGVQAWKLQFKRDVFARIVQTLNRLGWTCVIPERMIEQYSLSFARDYRYCRKGDLQADLEISGRCIKLKMFQNVNAPDRPDHDGRYQYDQEIHMPYLLRLEMERTRRRIRDYLCNVLTGYTFNEPKPRLGFDGVTALEYAAHSRRDTGHYVPELDRASFCNSGNDKSADGYQLENGTPVFAITRGGRVVSGVAFYSLNGNWQVVTGRYDLEYAWHNQIFVKSPGNVRVKRNADRRRKRLEAELASAIKAMKFERAIKLRDMLFPDDQELFNVWHEEHELYHRAGFSGYTPDQSQAGKFTATEVRGWDRAPNKVVPFAVLEAA